MKNFKFFTVLTTVGMLLFSTLFTGISAVSAETGTASSNEERTFIPDELIVEFKDNMSNFSNQNSPSITARFPELGLALVKVSEEKREDIKKSLENDKNVKSVQYNYIYRPLSLSNDQFSNWQWGLHNIGQTIEGITVKEDIDINLPEAWQMIENKDDEKLAEVIVAVIDDGVQVNHPDLKSSIWVNTKEDPDNELDDDKNGYINDINGWDFYHGDPSVVEDVDDGEHGTHVSGTIAATANNDQGIAGIAPNAKIMPLKFIHGKEGGNAWDAIAGIRYAEANGAKIILAAWGSTYNSKALEKAIKASKMLFVTAAGNDGKDNDGTVKNYPSSLGSENIISVGAVDKNGEIADFSNSGKKSVDLVAPGVSIYSTTPGNNYTFTQGTSMAAAHVAGVAALLAGIQDTFSPMEIKQVLAVTGKDVKRSKDNASGIMIDAKEALAYYLVSLPLDIAPIYDSTRYITGTTEPEATVYVKNKMGNTIKEAKADKEGNIKIPLEEQERFSANTELVIYSKKGLINSKEMLIIVGHDEEKPVLVGNSLDINDKSTKIEGRVSEYAKVKISIAGEEYFAVTDDAGYFSIALGKSFAKYTKGNYTLTDLANPANITEENFEVQDSEGPRLIVVPSVNDMSTVVKGQVSKEATVQLKVGNKFLNSAPVQTDESGQFEIKISKQKMGTYIAVIMVDKRGQENQQAIEVTDGTGPIISKLSKVYETSHYVEGFVNEASSITFQSVDGEPLGALTDDELSEDAKGLFTFKFKLPEKLAKNEKIKIVATDVLGNIGKESILTVQEDRTAPKLVEPKKIYIDDVGENEAGETIVTGKLSEEGTVDVKLGLRSILDKPVSTDEDGIFTVTVPKTQAKDKLTFELKDSKPIKPNTSKVTVTVSDKTAPKFIGDIKVYDSSRVITGVLDEAGKVMAMVEQSGKTVTLTSSTAKWNETKQGYVFTITMKEPQKVGTKIPLQAVDSSKNESKPIEAKVEEDTVSPELEGNLIITDKQTSVIGKVTKEATVQLLANDISISKLVKTDAAGNFRITIKKQKAGTKITVRVEDISGKFADKEVIVTDGTIPVISKVDTIYNTSKNITGKVSEQAIVTVSRNNTVIGTAETGSDGSFSIPVIALTTGEKLIIIAKDSANNLSKQKSITVRKDTTAPKVVLTGTIQVGATEIQGQLNEAGKVEATLKGLGTTGYINAKADGTFTIPLTDWSLVKGQTITITAVDAVGNKKDYKFKVTQ